MRHPQLKLNLVTQALLLSSIAMTGFSANAQDSLQDKQPGTQQESEQQQAKDEGITASIYTHPIGFHGHAAGPTIGLWDQQGGVPGRGDYPLNYRTAYSIELNSSTYIDEWGKEVRIMLEEDGYFDETGFRYIDGRQREFILIPRDLPPNKN